MKNIYLSLLLLTALSNAQIVQVKDIFTGSTTDAANVTTINSSAPNNFFDYNGLLLFRANDGTNGVELWKSDGTNTGTILVKNIALTTTNSNPSGFVNLGTNVFFNATTGTTASGQELWKTDGTDAGTTIVKDIRTGTASSNPQNLILLNPTTLLFSANDGTNGVELWKTNGTETTTVNVIDYAGTANSITWIENLNGTAILGQIVSNTGREIYKSDGTTIGSGLISEIAAGTTSGVGTTSIKNGNTIYFQGNSGTTGFELWKTNGTLAGTVLVKDINAGVNASSPGRYANLGTTVYFRATGANGQELWKTDGTETGTVEVVDIFTGIGNANPDQIIALNGAVYFFASDDGTNFDFYKYDGTLLTKLADFNALTATVSTDYALQNGKIYFAADSNADGLRELWSTDGTIAGTVAIASLFPGSINPTGVANVTLSNAKIFFSAALNNGTELFVFDTATLSNNSISKFENIKFYPNPTKGTIFVDHKFMSEAKYLIFDVVGKKVAEGTVEANKIELNLNKGVYLLKIESENQSTNRKIIIE